MCTSRTPFLGGSLPSSNPVREGNQVRAAALPIGMRRRRGKEGAAARERHRHDGLFGFERLRRWWSGRPPTLLVPRPPCPVEDRERKL